MVKVFNPLDLFPKTGGVANQTPGQAPATPVVGPGFGVPVQPAPAPAPAPVALPPAPVAVAAPPVQPPAAPPPPAQVQAPAAPVAPAPFQTAPNVAAAPPVTVAAAPAPAVGIPAPVAPSAAPASEDEGQTASAHGLKFGDKMSRYPVPRFKGVSGFNKRIAILNTTEWHVVKTHYEQGVGYYYCFEGSCCETGDPNVRYLAPIVVYDTDKDGNIVSAKFSIEYLALADSHYDALLMLHRALPLDTIDLIVMCTDDKFQKLSFMAGSPQNGAAWRQNQQFCEMVWGKYQSLKKHILRGHAKKLGANAAEAEAVLQRLTSKVQPGAQPGATAFNLSQFMNQGPAQPQAPGAFPPR